MSNISFKEFQEKTFDRAKEVAKHADLSGWVQNSFERMLQEGDITKEEIAKSANTFIDEYDNLLVALSEVKTCIETTLEFILYAPRFIFLCYCLKCVQHIFKTLSFLSVHDRNLAS